jgi:inorganic pyrophosphatase/exopolyphosphatase
MARAAFPVCETLGRFVSARRALTEWFSPGRTVHLFVGNEASDADSIVGSIVAAWAAQQRLEPAAHLCAPWIQCSRADLRLRAEVRKLLARVGVNSEELVFLEELDLAGKRGQVKLNLVDHNVLPSSLGERYPWFEGALESVIDHHADQKQYMVRKGVPRPAVGP